MARIRAMTEGEHPKLRSLRPSLFPDGEEFTLAS
jgi:hypothetical protein